MAYVTPIHPPTSIRTCMKLRLRDEDEECLAVGRYNRLELYTLAHTSASNGEQPELELISSTRIYGRITILNKFRPAESSVDHIFIGIDSCHFFTMAWDPAARRLRTVKVFQDLSDRILHEVQFGERSHIDPTGSFLTIEVYEGVITTIPLFEKIKKKQFKTGVMLDPINTRIPEFFVKDSAFVHPRSDSDAPRLALIEEDQEGRARLKIRTLEYESGFVDFADIKTESVAGKEKIVGTETLELGASHIIPLREYPWGLLVLGETSITHYDDLSYSVQDVKPLQEATVWVAWEPIDGSRYILADEYGKLWLLMWVFDNNGEADFVLHKLGETSRATCLAYLGEGILFIGAHTGDSQLVRIIEQGREILQTLPNIAPILDFSVMDMGNRSTSGPGNDFSSGQARVVTCSGAWNTGSIRSVRSGVGLLEQAIIPDVGHATQLFSLPMAESLSRLLLVGFVDETRVFIFAEDGDVEESADSMGLSLGLPTLYAGDVGNGHILQVTTEAAHVLDIEGGIEHAHWNVGNGKIITAVSVDGNTLALVVDGSTILILDIAQSLRVLRTTDFAPRQVSCVALSSQLPNAITVGFWHDSVVEIHALRRDKKVQSIALTEEEVGPRSILVNRLFPSGNPTILFSMADGHVISYEIDPATYNTTHRTITILGTKQPELQELPRQDGTTGVFVSSVHPSLIYADEGRLSFSAVDIQEAVNCVCNFDSPAFEKGIVLATPTDIKICVLQETRTTQVQPLYLGETVRRLAYSPTLKAFGLGTIRRWVEGGEERTESNLKLVDEVMFKELATAKLQQGEHIEAVIRAELNDRYGKPGERFIVGTSFSDNAVADKFRGRIIVYEVTEDRMLKLLASQSVKTECQTLAMVGDDIVAGLYKTIVVYSLLPTERAHWVFKKRATQRISTIPVSMCVSGNQIAISDIMKSVCLLKYRREGEDPEHPEPTLIEVASHYETTWATSLTQVQKAPEPEMWLQGDAVGNIIVVQKNQEGATSADRKRLQSIAEFRLGETVNKMHSIDVGSGDVVEPKAFMATREGALYLFALIAPNMRNFLITLQQNIAARVESPGNIPFNEYRAFKTDVRAAGEPYRFVDGELMERFLDLSEEVQTDAVKGVPFNGEQVTVEQTRSIVESLRRLH